MVEYIKRAAIRSRGNFNFPVSVRARVEGAK